MRSPYGRRVSSRRLRLWWLRRLRRGGRWWCRTPATATAAVATATTGRLRGCGGGGRGGGILQLLVAVAREETRAGHDGAQLRDAERLRVEAGHARAHALLLVAYSRKTHISTQREGCNNQPHE